MFTSSLLFNEPIVNFCDRLVEGNRAAGVEASGDVCGIFVGASAAKAFVFIFPSMKENMQFVAQKWETCLVINTERTQSKM